MLKKILPLAILPFLGFAQPAAAQPPYWWQGANPDAPGAQYYDDGGDYQAESQYGPDPYVTRDERFNEQQYRAYRREMARRYYRQHQGYPPPDARDYGYNNDYAAPYAAPVYPVQPKSKPVVQAKPVVKKKVLAPPKPATTAATTAPATTAPAAVATTPVVTGSMTTSAAAATPPVATPPATSVATASATNVTTPAVAATATSATAPVTTAAKKGGAVTCDKGMSIVSSFGFEKVATKSCQGASLVYSAERGGKPFEIEVNPKSGELTAVKKL